MVTWRPRAASRAWCSSFMGRKPTAAASRAQPVVSGSPRRRRWLSRWSVLDRPGRRQCSARGGVGVRRHNRDDAELHELPSWTHSLTPPETFVHLGSLANTRAPERVQQSRPLILCGRCGADRVIPLTFTPARRDDRHQGGWPDTPGRPLYKCLECRSHLGRVGVATPRTPQRPTSSAMLASRAPGPAVREVGPSG